MRHFAPFLVALALSTVVIGAEPKLAALISKAEDEYQEATERASADYRKSFAAAMRTASKVEVYLLDFETEHVDDAKFDSAWAIKLPEDRFPIVPYGSSSKILKRKKLTADEVKLLMPSLQATIGVERNILGAFCHLPIHGIRIWDGDDVIFQTSICYHCSNFYMNYPYGGAAWTNLSDPNFQKVMKQLMPIPQAEVDRFEAEYGPKNKKQDKK